MITVTDRIDLGNYEYINLDARYTNPNGNPFSSVSAAQTYHAGKMNELFIGLTVLVKESGWTEAKEYWVQPKGTTPETYGLVEKGAGTTDYADLDNKPTINNVPLSGNKTASDLGLATAEQGGKADTAIQGVSVNGTEVTPDPTTKKVALIIENGKSAYQLYLDNYEDEHGSTDGALDEADWLESLQGKSALQIYNETMNTSLDEAGFINVLKQNYPMEYVAYNQAAAGQSIGTAFAAIDQLAASASTAGKLYLMPNNGTTPTGTELFITVQTDATTYMWYRLGALSVPSNVLTEVDIVQDLNTGGADKVLSAEAGRIIAETTMEWVEGLNILDPSTILVGKKNVEGVVSDILSTELSRVYGCTDLIEIPDDGLILNKGKGKANAYRIRAAVYFDSSRNYIGYKEVSGSMPKECVVSKNDFVGAVYVAFNLPTLDNYSVETNGYAIYVGQTLPTPEYQPYVAPHLEQKKDDILYRKISSLAGDLSAVENEFNEEIPYYELTDNAFWACNEVGDIVSNNPETTTYVFAASPKIEVNVGEKYIIFGRGGKGTSRLFAVLDENSECIEIAESGVSYTESNPYVLEITNPDSKYLICSFQGADEHGVYNADLSFAASVNKSLGHLQDEIDLLPGKHKNILLDGASFAYSANSWFSKLCTKLRVVGYNKAVAGTQIFNTVNRLYAGTEYTFEEMENFEIFMLMHVYNRDVADETNLYNDYRDYENETMMPSGIASASTMTYSQAFDYVLKKYAADCYALKDNPNSKWYNSPCGKPCIVVVLTSWHDGRTVYNSSVRTLRDKWGFHLVEIDKNVGFSKNQLNPMTKGQQSLLYCYDHPDPQLDNDEEDFGWHPARTGVNGEYIQGRIADIVFSVVSRL